MAGDIGILHRTRTERDARLFLVERAERGRHKLRGRTQSIAIIVIAVLVVVIWGLIALLAGS